MSHFNFGTDGLNGDAGAVGIGSNLSIRNVAHHAGATDVARYFEEHYSGCRVLECRLYASKTPAQHVYVFHPPWRHPTALAHEHAILCKECTVSCIGEPCLAAWRI